ncbi:hypothetical protein F0562_018992 [Nyssa sinensis]|uniref:EF-hand domain-containing protein n=1 Tax=Nyssa sinensis TaxID=561372 RepID=A0A5J4ZDM2_9ASTE|nr:hypothetical protein F0562_018992 [Nyssa sinensis]
MIGDRGGTSIGGEGTDGEEDEVGDGVRGLEIEEGDGVGMASKSAVVFEDFFPSMVEKLGAEGFMNELCNGFRLLMDGNDEVITFESLKKNAALLGLQDMSDDELMSMLKEGDLDGDGRLSQMEFCVLMFRLSPDLMERSRKWLEETIGN